MTEQEIAGLTKYDPATEYIGMGDYIGTMEKADDGEYVLLSDVQALLATKAAQPQVPAKLTMSMVATYDYLKGWNDCVDAFAAPSASAAPAAPTDLSKHLREVAADPKADAISYLKHRMVLAADEIDRLAAAPSLPVAERQEPDKLTICGELVEVGRLEDENGLDGIVVSLSNGECITVKGMSMDQVKVLAPYFMDNISISFAAPTLTQGAQGTGEGEQRDR